jgi:hypothetical protein
MKRHLCRERKELHHSNFTRVTPFMTRGISTLPSDWGLGTSQGVMLSIGALKAKRLIYLPLVNFSTMTRCGCKSTRVVSRLISGIAASNPLVLRRSV